MKTEPESPQCYAAKNKQTKIPHKQTNKKTKTAKKKKQKQKQGAKGRKNEVKEISFEQKQQLFYSQVVKTNVLPREALESPFLESSFL